MTQPPDDAPPPAPPPPDDPSGGYWAPPASPAQPPYASGPPGVTAPPYASGPPGAPPMPPYGGGGTYLDPQSGLVLPNGLPLASHGRRIGAFFLAIPLTIVTLGIGYVIWGLILWPRGQTPTYQVLNMRCWRPETNEVPGFWWMALREIIGRFLDGVLSLITELTSFILFLATRERKSLHDYVAGTVVLYDPDNRLGR